MSTKSDVGGFAFPLKSCIFVDASQRLGWSVSAWVLRLDAGRHDTFRRASMVGQDKPGGTNHHGNAPAAPGRLGALALSLLESLLHRGVPLSPRTKSDKVLPQFSRRSRNSRSAQNVNGRSRREERSRREAARIRREGASGREGYSSNPPQNVSVRRSSSARQLKAGWSSRLLRQGSATSHSFRSKVIATGAEKNEAPEVVTNYVYDVPEKKPKVKADYDDTDDKEVDNFVDEEEEEEEEELDFDFRPFMSEDEDEMAYFAHRMGGPDFKLLRRHVMHPHGRLRSIWDTFSLVLITCKCMFVTGRVRSQTLTLGVWCYDAGVLIIVPFELCFNMNASFRRSILHLDLFVDSMFVVDILLKYVLSAPVEPLKDLTCCRQLQHSGRGRWQAALLVALHLPALHPRLVCAGSAVDAALLRHFRGARPPSVCPRRRGHLPALPLRPTSCVAVPDCAGCTLDASGGASTSPAPARALAAHLVQSQQPRELSVRRPDALARLQLRLRLLGLQRRGPARVRAQLARAAEPGAQNALHCGLLLVHDDHDHRRLRRQYAAPLPLGCTCCQRL
jgi:hypothetical protein